jgi:1-acyl-sn-glycerol-3-phosphate acyltransferase
VKPFQQSQNERKSPRKIYVAIILLLTPVFFYFAGDVSFNSDMSKLNFMSAESTTAQERLEKISPASLHTMFVTSDGKSLEEALRANEKLLPPIESLIESGEIKQYQGVSSLLVSDSLQKERIRRWESFWTEKRRVSFLEAVHDEGARLKFSPQIIARVDSIVQRKYDPMDAGVRDSLVSFFFANNVIHRENETTIVSLINVLPGNKATVQASLDEKTPRVFDRNMITSLFVRYIHDDFIFIVTFTSILVFTVLLISIGRIELTVVTFAPMMITWIWILGIMAILGIEFNIVNVMISTFIFGLGDDYSIFVMDGLVQEYRSGKQNLVSVRKSILLSALTTICGLGVLIFAGHPALRSIAAISIIGIICVFVMSQTIEPFLFHWLITSRTKRKLQPRTLKGMFFTVVAYSLFVFGSFLLTVVGVLFKLIPIYRRQVQWFYHRLLSYCTWTVMYAAMNLKKSVIYHNSDVFKRPGIIIANHSSFLDILTSTMVHPKIILLTNDWVYNSPIFGAVVRLADYYSVSDGANESIDQLNKKVEEGYSIVVFPEGTRSEDGKIRRFHKGAFFLAEKLNLPIYPLLIHGASESIPKSTMYVNDANITLKFLPAIEANDSAFGQTYTERAKYIGRYFRSEYEKLHQEASTPKALAIKLVNNYLYKSPVLEWYLRIKIRLENYYTVFDDLVPKKAKVLDLGCGYGFLCYMLSFRSADRQITGIDYDHDKIAVADHGYLKSDQLQFYCADIANVEIPSADVMIIADVLHYLSEPSQFSLLQRCFNSLSEGGRIIVRDGDQDLKKEHRRTRTTELFSVRIFKFNKAETPLQFVSGQALIKFASSHGFDTEVIPDSRVTSNRIFVMSRRK